MKPVITKKPFPVTSEQWAAAIAQAPESVHDSDCAYDPSDPEAVERFWARATVSRSLLELREMRPAHRQARGPQKIPPKVSTTIRFDADVLAALKATGKGWQSRVNQAVREWLSKAD